MEYIEKRDERPEYVSQNSIDKADDEKFGDMSDVAALEADIRATGPDIEDALVNAERLSEEDVLQAARDIITNHRTDPNFSHQVYTMAATFVKLNDSGEKNAQPVEYEKLYQDMRVEAALVLFNSPYAEVRAIVNNYDDPTLPVSTFRAWFIGLIFVAAGSFINQWFSIRYPPISVESNVAQVLAYPFGKLLERALPTASLDIFGHSFSLNPGKFNMKEHMLITIFANVGFQAPYTNYIVLTHWLPQYFNQSWMTNFGFQILVGLSTNFIGYGLAGLMRRFLVYPANAIWYPNLATVALNRAFHDETNLPANGWKISRMKYFLVCFTAMFFYYWFPGYIFVALSFFNWTMWIDPMNPVLSNLTGITGLSGLGINPWMTFDMNMIGPSVFVTPFWATMNNTLGIIIGIPIMCAVYFSNTWNSQYMSIAHLGTFDNRGRRYNVSRVLGSDGLFDQAAYEQYSPMYFSARTMLLYGCAFATYTATISHAILYHRREIILAFKSVVRRQGGLDSQNDVHSRIMRAYKEVPEWWYISVLVLSIGLGAAGIGAYPTLTTPAVVLYGIALAIFLAIPVGIIWATTNTQIGLNVIAEFFGGFWFRGNALAMNFFKTYGYMTTEQALLFAQDLKLAHYTHIPPRVTFCGQMVATFVSTFVAVGVLNFQLQIPDVCTPDNKDRLFCYNAQTFFTASVLWGTLGPAKMFGSGSPYSPLLYGFLIGAPLPVIWYFATRHSRIPWLKDVHIPLILSNMGMGMSGVFQGVALNWLFNVWIKKRYLPWWSKYNYITAPSFTAAMAICGIVIYFALAYNDVILDWWGNNVSFGDNCDALACAMMTVEPGEHFGPGVGEFH
ncbi:OPT oligopeptide transporter [Auriculariales sp. MPI-PUGE-AT-0066]|nr:OPT oligopeptide transporter [Auriculariales sp. MPI-PUGE-AT-0066]